MRVYIVTDEHGNGLGVTVDEKQALDIKSRHEKDKLRVSASISTCDLSIPVYVVTVEGCPTAAYTDLRTLRDNAPDDAVVYAFTLDEPTKCGSSS